MKFFLIINRIFLLLCLILSPYLLAKEVLIGMGRSVPPYIIQERSIGAEYEVIESALAAVGHKLKPVYLPLARVEQMLIEKKVDAATPLIKRIDDKLCYSKSHIQYQNVAIALKRRNFQINHLQDLKDKKIIAFQKAGQYLGKEFADIVRQNPNYHEYPDQNNQIHALFSGITNVIIADKNIFQYYYEHSVRKESFEDYSIYPIFPPSNYSVGFVDPKLCEDFNRGLTIIQKDNTYQRILNNYFLPKGPR